MAAMETLVLLEDDDEGPHPATTAVVRTHIKDALDNLCAIVSTGDDKADKALAHAISMLRGICNTLKD